MHPFLLVEELTREVMKLEKESYERIIRMIAHEVNNSVGAIGSTLCAVSDALRQEKRPEWEEFRPAVAASYDRCNHMSQFINKLADMVRIPEPMLSDVSTNCSGQSKRLPGSNARTATSGSPWRPPRRKP